MKFSDATGDRVRGGTGPSPGPAAHAVALEQIRLWLPPG